MPRYFCAFCDAYLTHDSASVRQQHNLGFKHKANVRAYYAAFDVDKQRIGLAPAGDCGQQAPPPPPMCSVAAPLHGALGNVAENNNVCLD